MIRRCLAVVLPALLMTAACLGPKPPLPPDAAVATPAQWRFEAGPAAPIDAAWWRSFNDPILAELVKRALTANPDVQQAAARVMQARAAEHEARAARGPQVGFMNLGGKIRQLEVVGPVTTPGDEAEVTVSWDFDIFRQLAHADKARRAELLAAAATRDAVKLSVASTVASDYIALLGADARLAITRSTLTARVKSLAFARRRAAVGYTSRLELHQAEAEYQSTEQMIPEAELAVSQREDALSVMIGEPPQAVPRSAAGLDGLTSPPIPEGSPSSLLRRRPDIYAAEEQMVAADQTLSFARAAMLPKFSLTAYYNDVYAPVLPMIENQYLYAGQIMAPIFDAGRRKAVANQAAAARNEAAYAYRGAVLTAVREVDDALAGVQKLTVQSRSQQSQVAALNQLLQLSARRYQEGYSAYFDQLDAQRQLLAAQLSLVQIQTQRLSTYVRLYQAIGGGWTPGAGRP